MATIIDYFTNLDADGADLEQQVPATCNDCGRPLYYDYGDEAYHHAVGPGQGCFLVPAEDRPEDTNHPLHPEHVDAANRYGHASGSAPASDFFGSNYSVHNAERKPFLSEGVVVTEVHADHGSVFLFDGTCNATGRPVTFAVDRRPAVDLITDLAAGERVEVADIEAWQLWGVGR